MIYDPSKGGMMTVFEKHKEELEGFEKLYSWKDRQISIRYVHSERYL